MYANQTAMFTAVVGAAALEFAIRQRRVKRPTVATDAAVAAAAEGMAVEWPIVAAQAAGAHDPNVQGDAEGNIDPLTARNAEEVLGEEEEEEEQEDPLMVVPGRHRRPARPRVYRVRMSFEALPDITCRRRLRFSRETVAHICHLLAHLAPLGTGGGHALPVSVKVTVALNFYATGSFQAPSGHLSGISQASVHRCIRAVTDALYSIADKYIKFPEDRAQQEARARGFAKVAGIPMVQGVIDGVHVPMHPPADNREVFMNRKGAYSMNIQVVCDPHMKIMHVCAKYPGSVHDAYILAQSFIPAMFDGCPPRLRGWLLGDKRYPLRSWLMTPIRRPQTNAESLYNEAHAATWGVVERCFGLLKMRFRCLDRFGGALQYRPDRVGRMVVVCCALHNIAMQRGDDLVEESEGGGPDGTGGNANEGGGEEEDVEEEDDGAHQDEGRGAGHRHCSRAGYVQEAARQHRRGQRARDVLVATRFTHCGGGIR
ncbi:putative nuclease HARBI1 [Scyliorhinus torazame]|uniref:putative nuclease HARBI1 n=1 Tax=Scyliorhinus torazame TaxID=75743 RepID=UPI003B5C475C